MDDLFPNLPDEIRPILERIKQFSEGGPPHPSCAGVQEWQGFRFPFFFRADTAKAYNYDYEMSENTILISSFPKTGTSWTVEIVRQLLYGSDPKMDKMTRNIIHPLMYLEFWDAEKWKLLKYLDLPRKYFGTHMQSSLVNLEKLRKSKSKIIVPIRNPKDQVVSWYHFTQGMVFDGLREHYVSDWNQFLSDFMTGKQPVEVSKPGESYAEFLLSWYEHRNDDNVLFVHFELLKKDTEKEIRRIADFLEIDIDDEGISRVAENTSFGSMKKNQEQGDSAMAAMLKRAQMLRKGGVGSWKDVFTVAQSEKMDEHMNRKLAGTDIKFIYE